MANSDNKVFDMMTAAADKLFVDRALLPKPESKIQLPEEKSEKSFEDFMVKLDEAESLNVFEKIKIRDLWIESGRPIVNIQKKGTKGFSGDVNRASYTPYHIDPSEDDKRLHRDQVNIFDHQLLDDFVAELAHGKQYALKEGESMRNWVGRRENLYKRRDAQREHFGESVYGGERLLTGEPEMINIGGKEVMGKKLIGTEKWFPYIHYSSKYSIGRDIEGKEIVVDNEGNVYPDMKVPEDTERGRTVEWKYLTPKEAIYDPKRRKGWNPQRGKWIRPTQEFEAHSIIEDSLLNVLKTLDDWNIF